VAVISVVGNIGSGKSTIVGRLAEALHGAGLVERFEENPFLAAFYADPERWVYVSQCWFTVEAMERALRAHEEPLAVMEHGPQWIMDVMTGSMRGTALKGDELALMDRFTRTYHLLATSLKPTVILALTAPVPVLLERIHARGRTFETAVTEANLMAINAAAEDFLAAPPARVVSVDTTVVDGRTPEGIATIVAALSEYLASAGNPR
jgi:deoxyguanosine kinase